MSTFGAVLSKLTTDFVNKNEISTIFREINEVCQNVKREKSLGNLENKFHYEVVLYDRLRCSEVRRWYNHRGEKGYSCTIREVNPRARLFQAYMREKIKEKGYSKIEVNFGW